jgi:(1->4)-alpha-D-glucan 1-alpha-D-glucosylmutase
LTAECLASFRQRVAAYMQKATKEAKVHTSWVNPNEEYDEAVHQFVARVLPDASNDPFLNDLLALQRTVAFFGYFNSLAQVLLKLTSPGVPDFYQGSEWWDLSLVDPDNRRPVDYRRRRDLLSDLQRRIGELGDDLRPLAAELLANMAEGHAKLYLIYRALHFRREHEQLFAHGSYLPLEAAGPKRDFVCAFARSLAGETVLVAIPRLVVRLTEGIERPPMGPEVWKTTRLLLPPPLAGRSYCNLFTGEVMSDENEDGTSSLTLATVFHAFPVAFLHCCEAGSS